jgi:ribonuclease P protein component
MQTARLGLVVSKRALRRAVDRNRAKRVLRETFRTLREELPEMDLIVQVVGPASNDEIRAALTRLLAELRNGNR